MKPQRRHKNSRRAYKARTNESHKKWIRGFSCVVGNHECTDRIECAHVRTETDGGMGLKPTDGLWTIPLCSFHHKWQTNHGEARFEAWYGVDMRKEAEKYAVLSPFLRRLQEEI